MECGRDASWGDETINRGELLCLKYRIAESGRIYGRQCKFRRHCFDRMNIRHYTAGLHAGLQGPNFESLCNAESPFPKSQQMLFLSVYTDYLATNIHDLYTIMAGVARRLFSGTHDFRVPISSYNQKSGAKGPH